MENNIKMEYLLTIAIPTYNRSSILEKKLEDISKFVSKRIEILVCDNASTDETEDICKKYPNIKYYKNKENLGFDGNILASKKHSSGKYVWFLGDDDEILDGSILTIVSQLESEEIDLLILNDINSLGERTFNDINTINNNSLNAKLDEKNTYREDEFNRFALISTWVWISRCIIKNNSIEENIIDKYLDTGLIHLAMLNLLIISKSENFSYCITSKPLIKNNPHIVFSKNFINVFANKFYELCKNENSKFSKKLILKASATNFNFVINSLARKKKQQIIVKYEYKFWCLLFKMFKYRSNVKDVARFIFWYFMSEKLLVRIKGYNKIENSDNERETFI